MHYFLSFFVLLSIFISLCNEMESFHQKEQADMQTCEQNWENKRVLSEWKKEMHKVARIYRIVTNWFQFCRCAFKQSATMYNLSYERCTYRVHDSSFVNIIFWYLNTCNIVVWMDFLWIFCDRYSLYFVRIEVGVFFESLNSLIKSMACHNCN